MADSHTKKQRSYNMSRIRRKNTRPELILKKKIKDYIYQPKIFGNPDFANYKTKTVLFVDGCFWHKCPKHFIEPKSNKKYWIPKIERNIVRDKEVEIAYRKSGWNVIRVWECEIKKQNKHTLK